MRKSCSPSQATTLTYFENFTRLQTNFGHPKLSGKCYVTPLDIIQCQISSTGEKGKEKHELSKLEFLEKFSANDFALSDLEDDTSRSLNKGGMADLLLLRTLLAIRQKCK